MQEITIILDKDVFSSLTDIPQFNHPEADTKLRLNDLTNGNLRVEILVANQTEWTHDQKAEHVALKLMQPFSEDKILPFGFDQSKAKRAKKEEQPEPIGHLSVSFDNIPNAQKNLFDAALDQTIQTYLMDNNNTCTIAVLQIEEVFQIHYYSYTELFKALIIIGLATGQVK